MSSACGGTEAFDLFLAAFGTLGMSGRLWQLSWQLSLRCLPWQLPWQFRERQFRAAAKLQENPGNPPRELRAGDVVGGRELRRRPGEPSDYGQSIIDSRYL